ncbi:MAG: DNA recombination protein RmuC [Ignavibacteriales bacterium]|nr:DNA recombination protein RmuC [Ignavibacteriales bacterium]
MELVLGLVLLIITGLLIVIVLRLRAPQQQDGTQAAVLIQQQIDSLRGEVNSSLRNTSDSLGLSLKGTQDALYQSLKMTSETMNQQLNVVTAQLSNVTQQLQNNTGQVGSRLDNAAKVIQDVQNKLGELGQATKEIKELGQSVSKLEEMLKAPKLRGGLGELLLEDLLRQVLPIRSFEMQYRFKSGQAVDAVIHLSGGMVPVDSKFPLENFQKMLEAKSEQEKRTAVRTFRSDVKKHIDAIADKYILPDEGTFDFALMYVPAENIYYETIIKDESVSEEEGLYSYAMKKRVIPVSPNSFYAHLRVIAMGFKGLQIEKSAKEIFQSLERLGSDLGKFSETFETLGTQLGNAKNNFDKADKQLNTLTEKFRTIQSIPEAGTTKQLDQSGGTK